MIRSKSWFIVNLKSEICYMYVTGIWIGSLNAFIKGLKKKHVKMFNNIYKIV